jgi:putative nucleotide binding protein
MEPQRRREEEAIVLDFLQNGYSFDTRPMHLKTPIAQALGTDRFTLLELVPKKDIHLQPRATVYIGDQKRDEIHHVNGKIPMDRLTATAQSELPHAIKAIIDKNPQRFVDFFNKAQPISIRTHSLELLPGIGKKHMQEIIEARQDKDFESFEDIKARVKLITDPEKLIINRVLNEIKGLEKHNLFVAPPASEEDEKRDSRPPRRFDGGPRREPRRF